MNSSKVGKPLEYWIGRATDPYLDKSDRIKCLEVLANKINTEAEAATICVDLLAHKVVSPDQDEALTSIQTVDYLMRNCGDRVHTRVGKYRFLNQLVKLLTPKYLGSQTSEEVKSLVIRLMFTWQKSIKHISKYKEVYATLKSNKLITEDPKIPEDEITVIPPPPTRCAVFEDEEKSKLLKTLLASNNPDDLNMANQLIKSLVQSEESKMAKVHDRRKKLDQAIFLCKAIEQMKMEKTAHALGLGGFTADGESKLWRAYDELSNLQNTIYSFASELAEANDPCLEEVLSINDTINKLLPVYEEEVRRNRMDKKEKTLLIMDNEELVNLNSPIVEREPEESSSADQCLEGSLLNNMVETELCDEIQDVPFIGFDKHMTPVLPRRSGRKTLPQPPPSESIFETDYLADKRLPEVPKPPTLNELTSTKPVLALDNLESLLPSLSPSSQSSNASPVHIPEDIKLDPSNVTLQKKTPLVVLDNEGVRILLYWCENLESKQHSYVASIQNANVEELKDVSLEFRTSDKNATVRLQKCQKNLKGFDISGIQENVNLLMTILPLRQVKEVDIDFSLRYVRMLERSISGNFLLPL